MLKNDDRNRSWNDGESMGPQEDASTEARRAVLGGLAGLCLLVSLGAFFFTLAALRDDWRIGEKEPFIPAREKLEPIPKMSFELPDDADIVLMSAESGELKLKVDDMFCINAWWDALNPVMRLGSHEITGRPLDHTPIDGWAKEIEVRSGSSPPVRHTAAMARFEIDFNDQELHRVTPFTVKMQAFSARKLEHDVFGPEEKLLESSGKLFAVTGDEWTQLQKRESTLEKRRRQRRQLEFSQVGQRTYNNAIDRAIQQNEEIRSRRRFWLFVSLGIAACGIALAILAGAPVRAGFNALLAAGLIFCLAARPWTLAAPEKLPPLKIPAELENLPPPLPGLTV